MNVRTFFIVVMIFFLYILGAVAFKSNVHTNSISKFFPINFCIMSMKFRSHIMCNGRIDCPDGSDETYETCQRIKCSEKSFQCDYGACVNREQVCDGIFNCADGSDESQDLCKTYTCKVPYPTNDTAYYIEDCEGECGGISTKDGSVLHYICIQNNTNISPILSRRTICRNGSWKPFVPYCLGSNGQEDKMKNDTIHCQESPSGINDQGDNTKNETAKSDE